MDQAWTQPGHADIWEAALAGEDVDWHALLAGYHSALDWPVCSVWRELAAAYPDCPILLSVRDPEKWWDSFQATIGLALARPMPPFPIFEQMQRLGTAAVVRTNGEALHDRDAMIASVELHNAAVRSGIPAERLLEYDVRDGWEPLCAFLGLRVPDEPFPHVNDREYFQAIFGLTAGQ